MGVPTYMYRRKGDEVEAEVFDSDEIPAGWVESPEKALAKPRRGRPPKKSEK